MFGKPEWFREREKGWGVTAVSWQAKVYQMTWAAIVVLPTLVMLALGKFPESGIWLALSGGTCLWDIRSVAKQLRQKRERDALFYIGEEADAEISTDRYDLRTRQEA